MATSAPTQEAEVLGLGLRGPADSPDELGLPAPGAPGPSGLRAGRGRAPAAPRGRRAAARRGSRRRRARGDRARTTCTTRAHAHLRAGPTATSCAASAATSTTRPTWWPTRATRPSVGAVLDWCGGAGVAAIPYGGGTSVVGGVERGRGRRLSPARCRIDLARARPRARGRPRLARGADPGRGARPGARGPAARRTASRCATSRSRSSSRRSAAGSRPARAATTPRCYTHIDDLVESMRVVTPARRVESRAGCPARARGRARTGCSSARRACSASSPRRGCGCRTGRASGVGRRALRQTSSGAPRPCAALVAGGALPDQLPAARRRRGRLTGAGADGTALLVLGFESADHPLDAVDRARGRAVRATTAARARREAQRDRRRDARAAPRARGASVPPGAVPARRAGALGVHRAETFETACTWDRFDDFARRA